MFDFIWKLRNTYYGARGRSNFKNSPLNVSKAFEMNFIALSNIGGGEKKKGALGETWQYIFSDDATMG